MRGVSAHLKFSVLLFAASCCSLSHIKENFGEARSFFSFGNTTAIVSHINRNKKNSEEVESEKNSNP